MRYHVPIALFGVGPKSEIMRAQRLLRGILMEACAAGYVPVTSADLHQIIGPSAWIFHKVAPQQAIKCTSPLSIGILSDDTLQIAGPDGALDIVELAASQHYRLGVQSCDKSSGIRVVKLKGYPWGNGSKLELMNGRALVRGLFSELARQGYTFLSTCNHKGTSDTLFFTQSQPSHDRFAMLSLNSTDCLRLLGLGVEEVGIVRSTIGSYWSAIQQESSTDYYHEFKLKGTPWWSDGTDAVASRMLVTQLLQALKAVGWRVECAVDVTSKLRRLGKNMTEKSSLLLRSCPPAQEHHMCISFNESDKVRVLNCPDMVDALRSTLQRGWPYGISRERNYGGAHEFKLNGHPWWVAAQRSLSASLAMDIMHTMEQHGWTLVCACDTSAKFVAMSHSGIGFSGDVDSWYFTKPVVQAPDCGTPSP
eukprot:TRINITY_DN457_c0_g1_i3.p1 TRINITY_DN457_c0_g1~~TRINITY_DN457_c0_g1_i3.p1  ORF type:complete len:421 (+),score=105.19 TRINITY_DN457_c0_g1_i3:286-1548(+)